MLRPGTTFNNYITFYIHSNQLHSSSFSAGHFRPAPLVILKTVSLVSLSGVRSVEWQSQGGESGGYLIGQLVTSVAGGAGIAKTIGSLAKGYQAAKATQGLIGGSHIGNAIVNGAEAVKALDDGGKLSRRWSVRRIWGCCRRRIITSL